MKGFKEAYKSIFHHYNEHVSHENSFQISNMHWIHFIPNQSFMNIRVVKKNQFRGNQFLFQFLNLYVEKNSREGCGLYDDI